jgi:colicin import membrane protein|tara:strand:- start:2052 stop:2657 length:606 start_codon:yes stop_codon:yes gene_type:complete
MNYFAPFALSLFIHFGIVLSLSDLFKINFDNFNIEAKKPIEAYLIFEEQKIATKKKRLVQNKELIPDISLKESNKIIISDINKAIEDFDRSRNRTIEIKTNNKEILKSDLIKYSSSIRNQVLQNWIRPSKINFNLKTEIEIILVPTGEILSATVVKGSGNDIFDESALRAISKVNSFEGLNMQMNLFDEHFRNFILIFSPE